MKHDAIMSGIFAFAAIVALAAALLFAGFGEGRNAIWLCLLMLLCTMISGCYQQLSRPGSYSLHARY